MLLPKRRSRRRRRLPCPRRRPLALVAAEGGLLVPPTREVQRRRVVVPPARALRWHHVCRAEMNQRRPVFCEHVAPVSRMGALSRVDELPDEHRVEIVAIRVALLALRVGREVEQPESGQHLVHVALLEQLLLGAAIRVARPSRVRPLVPVAHEGPRGASPSAGWAVLDQASALVRRRPGEHHSSAPRASSTAAATMLPRQVAWRRFRRRARATLGLWPQPTWSALRATTASSATARGSRLALRRHPGRPEARCPAPASSARGSPARRLAAETSMASATGLLLGRPSRPPRAPAGPRQGRAARGGSPWRRRPPAARARGHPARAGRARRQPQGRRESPAARAPGPAARGGSARRRHHSKPQTASG